MAIKTDGGTFLVQPEPQSQTGGVELDSRFFTPNTLIWGAPITLTLTNGTRWNDWQTTVERTKAGDPRAPITAMATPTGEGTGFQYSFDPSNPNWIHSTFYGDRLSINTRYKGAIIHPVAPSLNPNVWTWDSSISGLSLKRELNITETSTILWPSVVAAKTITVEISGPGHGSCSLSYRRNNMSFAVPAADRQVFYADPNTQYILSPAPDPNNDWRYDYWTQDSAEVFGIITHNIRIRIVFYPKYTPTPEPVT